MCLLEFTAIIKILIASELILVIFTKASVTYIRIV